MSSCEANQHLVADQLFAILDTSVRALQPETQPRILASDTVGFVPLRPRFFSISSRWTKINGRPKMRYQRCKGTTQDRY